LTWIDWEHLADPLLPEFVRGLLELRRTSRAYRRELFFHGVPLRGGARKDVTWVNPDGIEMSQDDWHDPGRRRIGLVFGDEHPDRNGPILLMHLNAHDAAFRLVLPHHPAGWELLVDTAGEPRGNVFTPLAATAGHELQPRSLVLFRSRSRTDP
jgi:glycogen operon protein